MILSSLPLTLPIPASIIDFNRPHRQPVRHVHTPFPVPTRVFSPGPILALLVVLGLNQPGPAYPAHLTLQVPLTSHSTPTPPLRRLHGINKGPLTQGGLINLTPLLRPLQIPHIRLHDCQWPYPDVVDMHAIFRNPEADPQNPKHYDFKLTDDYLEAVVATGAQIVYRLGESIEHGRVKRFVHPPADPQRWADACVGIVRHYNEGWANGFRYGIRYWEIWNEPENRPAMWSGTDADYFKLYQVTATTLRRHDPQLKIGGPAVGDVGHVRNGAFQPSAFTQAFLNFVRQQQLPLDFFSWHTYTDSPEEVVQKARGVRALLDSLGFSKTESHLNEWNYLPDRSWEGMSGKASPRAREAYYKRMSGAEGAAFVTRTLIELQDVPVDMCHLFHGEVGPFGLFSEQGEPQPNAAAWAAFALLGTSPRLPVHPRTTPHSPHLWSAVATHSKDENEIRLLIALSSPTKPDRSSEPVTVEIQVEGLPPRSTTSNSSSWSAERLDSEHLWGPVATPNSTPNAIDVQNATLTLTLTPPSVALVKLRTR